MRGAVGKKGRVTGDGRADIGGEMKNREIDGMTRRRRAADGNGATRGGMDVKGARWGITTTSCIHW
jgi:hypothetical protein